MEKFVKRANSYDGNRDDFPVLIKEGRALLGCSFYELGMDLITGAGTISRFEAGFASPPEVGRKATVNRLKDLIEFAAKFD